MYFILQLVNKCFSSNKNLFNTENLNRTHTQKANAMLCYTFSCSSYAKHTKYERNADFSGGRCGIINLSQPTKSYTKKINQYRFNQWDQSSTTPKTMLFLLLHSTGYDKIPQMQVKEDTDDNHQYLYAVCMR